MNCAAQSIAMHAQLTRGLALIAMVALQDVQYEPLLKFAYCLRIQNATFVHLSNESFELVLHNASLSSFLTIEFLSALGSWKTTLLNRLARTKK